MPDIDLVIPAKTMAAGSVKFGLVIMAGKLF